ncbi:unnamed protein product [Adineta ricciae]|uniref:G-protein coupled receptors family 1 profile domain-containing protein n=1 Tax=Adineta ricciae TaxID=249248 RepID=A0A815C5R0_ADIRI|nr:unnamed protein product [Adineta ricciae]
MSLMLFTHYLLGYVGTAMCSIGLALALCSVYIFTRRHMRSAVSTYLAALSISDSCLLSLGIIFAINSSIPPSRQSESFYSSYLHKHLFPYVYACIIWFQFTSVWITIGFAVDRWFAIKWPMLHYTYSSKRACYIVVTIYCLGFIYSLPRFFEYKTGVERVNFTNFENETEFVDYTVIENKLQKSPIYQYTVHLILYSLFQSILPLLMLSYFNVELIRSVNASSHFLQRCTSTYRQTARTGGETSSTRYREGVITRSVICLIGLFILCQVPASILNYIYLFYRNYQWLYICYDISNFLILLNSAVNFFIFTCFNRKFRRELARVCFYTRNRSGFFRTTSNQSLKRTSSQHHGGQRNQFDNVHPNYWEYQQRLNSIGTGYTPAKSSKSDYQLNTLYQRSDSLVNIPTTNQIKYGRYSVCEFNQKKSSFINNKDHKSTNFAYQKTKSKNKDVYPSHTSEKYSVKPTKYPLSNLRTRNNSYNRAQPLHYVNCRRDDYQQSLSKQSSSTTSNYTRSTVNVSSESSGLIDQHKIILTLASNQIEPFNLIYRK